MTEFEKLRNGKYANTMDLSVLNIYLHDVLTGHLCSTDQSVHDLGNV